MTKASRLKLHTDLCEILGTTNVYFQPPESITMKYPAIVYSLSDIGKTHAGDGIYGTTTKYKVTLLDKNPDSDIVKKLSDFKFSVFDRYYTANGLNHYMFTINYTKK